MTRVEEENDSKLREVKKSSSGEAEDTNSKESGGGGGGSRKEICICSPTTHPGSFRCRLHRACPRSIPKNPKVTKSIGLSRFANDVSKEINK